MVKLTITNKTHWQSRDIGKMLRACVKYTGYKYDLNVMVGWAKPGNTWGEISWNASASAGGLVLALGLPKTGPRMDPLTALAATNLSDEPILSPQAVNMLSRHIALSMLRNRSGLTPKYRKRRQELTETRALRTRPDWLPNNCVIKRYTKKKQPAPKSFMEKVEEALGRAESRVEEWEGQVEHAQSMLERAQRDLKKEQRRLRDARTRAQERGEKVERIGPSHRLWGRI